MEWATKDKLLNPKYFETSMALHTLETFYGTPIHDSVHYTRRFEYPWVYSNLPLSGDILDVGAGATAFQVLVSQKAAVTSIDVDTAAVHWVNQLSTVFMSANKVKSIIGGFPKLPFADKQFDSSYCISVLEHLPKTETLQNINELRRVTRGKCFITMDVSIGPCDRQVDLSDFNNIAKNLFRVPSIPNDAITFVIDGYTFAVACIIL